MGKPGTNPSFASLKQVTLGFSTWAMPRTGPANGPAVILLHGWPYDIHSFADVSPLFGIKGYRVVTPYLRGYGTTRFLSSDTFRNAQQSVVALDIIALMDALKIQKAIIAGFDWGARTADIMAALWPDRCKAIVAVSGYLIRSPASRTRCRCRRSLRAMVVPVLFRPRARPSRVRETQRLQQTHLEAPVAESGISMMRPTIAPRRPSTIRTTSPS